MRLALLGPAPPFRGGIVTYSANLCRTLEERGHEVYWASFKRQYPGWLFPGTAQEGETAAWLDHVNQPRLVPWSPWSWRQTARDLRRQEPVAVVFPYWIPFFAPAFWGVLRQVRRQMRVIALLHNVVPHERYPLGPSLTRRTLRQAHGYVAQSDQVRQDLMTLLPSTDPARVITAPHPLYDFGEPGRKRKTRAEARAVLGLTATARVILYFGFIKPYKGVLHLIDAVPRLRERFGREGVRVLVVGDVYGDARLYRDRIGQAGVGDVISLVDRFVPDEEVEDYFLASDLVALPYVSATQSGIVQIAWNYERPVVTTDVGGLPEVVHDGVTGFVVPPGDPAALAAAIIRFFDENHAAAFETAITREKEKYGWDNIARAIEDLVEDRA